jgi:hypothetical protein
LPTAHVVRRGRLRLCSERTLPVAGMSPFRAPVRASIRYWRWWAAIAAAAVLFGGAALLAISSAHRSTEQQHTLTCLPAYMAYVRVIGGPPEKSIERLRKCELSPIGHEPVGLDPTEHPFVVEKYEACLAAHLLLSSDLRKSLAQQDRDCH